MVKDKDIEDDTNYNSEEEEEKRRTRRSTHRSRPRTKSINEQPEKPKRLTYEAWIQQAIEKHNAEKERRRQNSIFVKYKYGRKIKEIWLKFWNLKFWKYFLGNAPYLLAFLMILFGGLIVLSGPLLGVWVVEFKGVKYGAIGACSNASGGNEQCSYRILYKTPPVGKLWNRALSVLLLLYGLVASLHLIFLTYTFLFIRHGLPKIPKTYKQCRDPESLRSKGKGKKSLKFRKQQSQKWFRTIMDLSSFSYIGLTPTLTWWLSESGADAKGGYDFAIFLLFAPFIWFFIRLFYRSTWLRKALSNLKRRNTSDSDSDQSDSEYDDDSGVRPSRDDKGNRITKPNPHLRRPVRDE